MLVGALPGHLKMPLEVTFGLWMRDSRIKTRYKLKYIILYEIFKTKKIDQIWINRKIFVALGLVKMNKIYYCGNYVIIKIQDSRDHTS